MNRSRLCAVLWTLAAITIMALLASCAAVDTLDPTAPQNKKYVSVGDVVSVEQHVETVNSF